MADQITVLEWWEKQTSDPHDLFSYEFNDVKNWASITDTAFTLGTMCDYFLDKYGSLLINDYSRNTLVTLTRVWHNANKYRFAGMAETTKFEYNPIENYNRTEEETITETPDITETEESEYTPGVEETVSESREYTEGGTTETESETGGESTGKTAPFDSSVFANDTNTETSVSGSETVTHGKTEGTESTVTTSKTGADTNSVSKTRTGTNETEREANIHGNIGVVTTQEMIRQEREIVSFVFLDYYFSEWCKAFTSGIWYSEPFC